MSAKKKLAKAVKPASPKIKTGILVSYVGSYATVNIEGSDLLLPMLDSVDTAVPVGSTMVCQVYGSSGYVIGSLNNTSRIASDSHTGSYYNPPVPKPSTLGYNYTNFSARQYGTFNIDILPFTVTSTAQTFADATGNAGYWFYGTNAFTSLSSKTIQSIEVFLSPIVNSSDSYPIYMLDHSATTRPSTTFTQLRGFQTVSKSGWVTLDSTILADFKANYLSGFGVGFRTGVNQATLKASAPYGTLRVGWTN